MSKSKKSFSEMSVIDVGVIVVVCLVGWIFITQGQGVEKLGGFAFFAAAWVVYKMARKVDTNPEDDD